MDARVELDSVVIKRPIDVVFRFMTNMENSPKWGRSRSTTKVSDGSVSVGTRFREVAAGDEGEMAKETLITGLHAPRSYSYTSRYESGIEEKATVTLRSVPGGTSVQPTAEIHLPGLPQELEEAVVREMQAQVSRLLANLKTYLEGHPV
jgi:uncharacterized membrane protein